MITHYLPRWLLDKFRGIGLFELDIQAGQIMPRKTAKAGSGDDLWPPDVENDLMGTHDNAAAQIYRKCLAQKDHVVLSDADRHQLAMWLVLFMPRVPAASETLRSFVDAATADPSLAVRMVYGDPEGRRAVLQMVRNRNLPFFEAVMAEYGTLAGEQAILALVAELVENRQIEYCPTAESAYHNHLRKIDPTDMANVLCSNYQWVWLRSDHGFILGDNPLVRWHTKSGQWNLGIRQPGVEITMPLGKSLSLLLRRPQRRYQGQLLDCCADETRQYNLRQRLAAVDHVYAGDAQQLVALKSPILPQPNRRPK